MRRAENPFRRTSKTSAPATAATQASAILNKLSRKNATDLFRSFCAVKWDDCGGLNKCVDIIFDKAAREYFFADLYATLCAEMAKTHGAFR